MTPAETELSNQARLTGTVDWYRNDEGYGVIRGDDGREYFLHHTNAGGASSFYKGEKLSFLARSRRRGKSGLEAYAIDITPAPARPAPASPERPAAPAGPTEQRLSSAAAEALQLKRDREKGLRPARTADWPPGALVEHAQYGVGEVVASFSTIVSVRFKNAVYDLPRSELKPAQPPPVPVVVVPPIPLRVSRPRVAEAPSAAQRTVSIADWVHSVRRETQALLTNEGFEDTGHIYHYEPGQEPDVPPGPIVDLAPEVAKAFAEVEGITNFYSHQVEARQSLCAGKHVVLTTPTASGKTASYNPTILETLTNDTEATAIYIFPLVALALDQYDRLTKLNNHLPADKNLTIAVFNSTVSKEAKRESFRADNRVVVTTPESLHYLLLPKPYPNWRKFFRNLRYIVVDEAHMYKGVFGSNMANILRRLLIRSRREGNPAFPQVIIVSATLRSPLQLAEKLTGLPKEDFVAITRNGACLPGRHMLVTRADVLDLCTDLLEATTIDVRTGHTRPVTAIVFLRSIAEVKQRTAELRRHLSQSGRQDLVPAIAEFYSDKSDKADVLLRLRAGDIRCIFTTTALMAGIDIGSLDVTVVKGFPGRVMDARQMFGRAGRAGEGAAFFLADRKDPFDQFYLENPELLFTGDLKEEVPCNPENPFLLAAHIRCAAQGEQIKYDQEGPLPGEYKHLFGAVGEDLIDILTREGALVIRNGACFLPPSTPPPHDEHPLDDIRAMRSDEYSVIDSAGRELEKKQQATAFRDAHPGALFTHESRTYLVTDFSRENRTITCHERARGGLRTQGIEQVSLEISEVLEGAEISPLVRKERGRVKVSTTVRSYLRYGIRNVLRCRNKDCRYQTTNLELVRCPKCKGQMQLRQEEKMIDEVQLSPTLNLTSELETIASWIEFNHAVVEQFDREFWPRWDVPAADLRSSVAVPDFDYAVNSVKHALLQIYSELVLCDREDIRGAQGLGPQHQRRIYLYDNFKEGLGFADAFYDNPEPFFERALQLVEKCNCDEDEGCPVCLKHIHYRSRQGALSKLAARYLLHLLLGQPMQPVLDDLKDYPWLRGSPAASAPHPNAGMGTSIEATNHDGEDFPETELL